MGNYQKIIESFKNGEVLGLPEANVKPEYLQTEISHIFLFPKNVYKFYRRDSQGFNEYFFDLNDDGKRKNFYQEEFATNRYFNPDVYLRLVGLSVVGDKVSLIDESSSPDDRIIEMKRVMAENNLTGILLHGELSLNDCYEIGDQMTKSLVGFNKGKELKGDYFRIMRAFLEDLENYLYMYDKDVPREESSRIIESLRKFIEGHRNYFGGAGDSSLIETIDNHADNTFYNNGRVSFIDAYLPKDSWRIVDPYYGVYRLMTDIAVLGGDSLSRETFRGFQNSYPNLVFDIELDTFYKVYFSCIRMGHFWGTAKDDPSNFDIALRYLNFIREKMKLL